MNNVSTLKIGISWVILILFLTMFNPSRMPIIGLVVPFTMLWFSMYLTTLRCQEVYARYFRDKGSKRRRILSATVASVSVVCLGLSSIGEFTGKDFGTVLLFASVAYFYLTRNIRKAQF
jgi:hypothetical protein